MKLNTKPDAVWRLVSESSEHQIYVLLFSDRFRIELVYHPGSHSAEAFLADKQKEKKGDGTVHDTTVYETRTDNAHSALHAQQWAGCQIFNLLHNVAADCKAIQAALGSTKGWQDLAAQNL